MRRFMSMQLNVLRLLWRDIKLPIIPATNGAAMDVPDFVAYRLPRELKWPRFQHLATYGSRG